MNNELCIMNNGMKLSFFGAALEVTGSCYLLEHNDEKILIDCGMFQGGAFNDLRNFDAFIFNPKLISKVVLTHAHLDHSGRLPKLIKEGFQGPIYANPATIDLTELVLMDAVDVMRYHAKKNGEPLLFEEKDVNETMKRFEPVDYKQGTKIGDFYLTFRDAGHILGSAFVELEVEKKRLVFSGDIGNSHVPIVRETKPLGQVDYLVLESTYGNKIHESSAERIYLLQEAIVITIKRGGVLMIPSFSLERTQEILYELNNLIENNLIPKAPIFLDSPLAAAATIVYKRYPQYFDEAAAYLVGRGDDFFNFPGLQITQSVEESKAINNIKGPKIIIAGSGMMNGGRILHHALRYLGDPKSCLLIVGFQPKGSLGRRLLDGEKSARIYGQEIEVKAEIKQLTAYSAHGDQAKLLSWIKEAKTLPKKIFLSHGDADQILALKEKIETDLQITVETPGFSMSTEI